MPEVDEELAAAWLEWWAAGVPGPHDERVAAIELANLQEHLAAHGFAIVRLRHRPAHGP